jgi:hypothetical protein
LLRDLQRAASKDKVGVTVVLEAVALYAVSPELNVGAQDPTATSTIRPEQNSPHAMATAVTGTEHVSKTSKASPVSLADNNFELIRSMSGAGAKVAREVFKKFGPPDKDFVWVDEIPEDHVMDTWRDIQSDPGRCEELGKLADDIANHLVEHGAEPKSFEDFKIKDHRAEGLYWWDGFRSPSNDCVEATLTAEPWPSAPDTPMMRKLLAQIKRREWDVFPDKANARFNVDKLIALASHHPNKEYLASVERSLKDGVWPKYDEMIEKEGMGPPMEFPYPKPLSDDDWKIVMAKLREEQADGKFSMATDRPLLGTKYVNQFVRVQGEKNRVVNDHSFPVGASNNENQPGEKTVIDGLDRLVSFLAVYHLGMKSLGYDKTHKIVIRKFDFQAAYRQVPLHPVAALKQAVKTKGGATLYDLYAAFGMKNAGNMWDMIGSLVGFIAVTTCELLCCLLYVDDMYGVEIVPIDHPNDLPPRGLSRLKSLCNYIGIAYGEHKAVHGSRINVLGFICDSEALSFSLADKKKQAIFDELDKWICDAESGRSKRAKEFMRLGGYLKTSTRVFLQSLYSRIGGRLRSANIKIGSVVKADLKSVKDYYTRWSSTLLLRSVVWLPMEADFVQFADASKKPLLGMGVAGVGIYWPAHDIRLYVTFKTEASISMLEMWAQIAGLSEVVRRHLIKPNDRFAMWTDNEGVAESLSRRKGIHNDSIPRLVGIELDLNVSVRAHWIRGEANPVADRLLRMKIIEGDTVFDPGLDLWEVIAAEKYDGSQVAMLCNWDRAAMPEMSSVPYVGSCVCVLAAYAKLITR